MNDRLRLIGSPASPYTRKMLALLRFRQIPHAVLWCKADEVLQASGIAVPKPLLLPVCIPANAQEAVCDSTPLIRRLESEYSGRSVIPDDAALAFIDYLLEDFADEWCTKPMFHYRWHYAEDADNAGTQLPLLLNTTLTDAQWQRFKTEFPVRQISRLYVVGSNEQTAALISASYERLLKILEAHFAHFSFLLGERPAACDFALFGQLSQLIGFDPTSQALAKRIAPRTVAWTTVMDDQSGLSLDSAPWFDSGALPDTLRALLVELGRGYVPAMLANAAAVADGEQQWSAALDNAVWQQQSFPYQAKCLRWLRQEFALLEGAAKDVVISLLTGSGCELLFEESE